MSLRLSSVAGAGDPQKERLVMRAGADIDIGDFVVLLGREVGDDLVATGSIEAAYWFPNKEVSKGDFVVLYSKSGKDSEKMRDSGGISHFFYWGAGGLLWKGTARPILLRAPEYQVLSNLG